MTTIETLKQISIQHSKNEAETDALEEAIKALENQPKYENALEDVIKRMVLMDDEFFCYNYCPVKKTCITQHCYKQLMRYIKRKAGLEVSE